MHLDGEHVVFQRVHYTDIFGTERFSGSAHVMLLRQVVTSEGKAAVITDGGTVKDKPEYWKWN